MKLLQIVIIASVLLTPQFTTAQKTTSSQRAWAPFFASFKAAVKKHDREALTKMMARDFYYLSSGGDENGNGDTRDEAFDYWENAGNGPWEALATTLAHGAVVNTTMLEPGSRQPSRIAPPEANNKKAIKDRSFKWYAVFEFRNGAWVCTAFTECCD